MALTTMDQIGAAMDTAQRIQFFKDPVTGVTAGVWRSLWDVAGRPSAGGFLSAGNARQCSAVFPISVQPYFGNPSGSRASYALGLSITCDQPGTVLVYDRLLEAAFNGSSATLQTFTYADPTKINARPAGVGITGGSTAPGAGDLWLEARATTAAQGCVVNYVSENGIAVTTPTFTPPAGLASGSMLPIQLFGQDRGVRTITSVQPAANMGGTMNLVVLRRIAQVEISAANIGRSHNVFDLRMPRIADDPCLAFAFLPAGTSTGRLVGSLDVGQG
ncbi:MAG TPA: hypothetical protein VFF65_12845 [Phycisphaerales bacterium]|nr:hypothetical protein [Phycisphaerales bacterium]